VLKVKREWLVRKVRKVCKEFKAYKEFKDQLVHKEFKVLLVLLDRKVKKEIRERKDLQVQQVQQDAMEFHRVEAVVAHKDQLEIMDQMVCLPMNLHFKMDLRELCHNGLRHWLVQLVHLVVEVVAVHKVLQVHKDLLV
jgi:hypothetical protein